MPVPHSAEILEVVERGDKDEVWYFVQVISPTARSESNAVIKPRRGNDAKVRNRSGRGGPWLRKEESGCRSDLAS